MIVVMKSDATMADISGVVKALESMGCKPHPTRGADRTVIGVVDARQGADFSHLESAPGVEQVIPITKAYKMVSREFRPQNTIVNVNGVAVGGDRFVVMAGPCAVENREQVIAAAGEEIYRLFNLLFIGTSGVMNNPTQKVSAYRMVLELPGE